MCASIVSSRIRPVQMIQLIPIFLIVTYMFVFCSAAGASEEMPEFAVNLDLKRVLQFGGSEVHRRGEFGASAVLHRQPGGKAW